LTEPASFNYADTQTPVRHPLDPLDADEIRTAAQAVRAAHPQLDHPRFALLTLDEPEKELVRAFDPDRPPPRRAFVEVLERGSGSTYEGVVDLEERRLVAWRHVPGVQPAILPEEFPRIAEIVRADPAVRALLAERGVQSIDLVQIDPWAMGSLPVEGVDPRRRLVRALAYVREFPGDNGLARPLENLVFIVDPNAEEVVKIVQGEPVPLPPESGNYDVDSVGPLREDLRPLEIRQPEGVSFTVTGNEIAWQRWRVHVCLHPVDGLVLHQLRYEDSTRDRPILYRAAISEMVVPYGDPSITFHFRNVFDAGEYHLGKMVGPLELGCDCLGEITYLDALLADEDGEPFTIKNAICIHEEDDGILWKHWDFRYAERSEVRRARRLVISTITTVGNYEYGFYWYLHLDGTIHFEVKLTGIIETKALQEGESSLYGTTVAPRLDAPNHQHIFNVRLDMEIDGPRNSVYELDAVPLPRGPDNPYGNAIVARSTLIGREREGMRRADPMLARSWRIANPHVLNRLGEPVAYRLLPSGGPVLLADEESECGQRAAFARHHLWVTRYSRDERHAAGEYPNQHPGGAGLPAWVAQDRLLENTDVVLWHTIGSTHLPRPEDWPVMPVDRLGFMLKPDGFFDRNPALDVPPSCEHCQPAAG
jgi:primary-amine oxidase